MNNLYRLTAVILYPLVLALIAFRLFKHPKYHKTLKEHYKSIIINTLIVTGILAIGIVIFFKIEDTVYTYDYAGHWVRSLELRQLFYDHPQDLYPTLYHSILYDDYSYLPGFFSLALTLWNTSYGYFVLCSILAYFIPLAILLQLIYFTYIGQHKYLPIVVLLGFYPLFYVLFYGESDLAGVLFLTVIYLLIILPDFGDIPNIDCLSINLYAFIAIALRRWYLYPVAFLYLALFFKYLYYHRKDLFSKRSMVDFLRILSSGVVMLTGTLLFFYPLFERLVFNNYSEAYAYNDHQGKLKALINFYSPLILIIFFVGAFRLFKENKVLLFELLFLLIPPTIMFWMIQSFEHHHYYIISLNVIILVFYGFELLFDYRKNLLTCALSAYLLVQSLGVFTFNFDIYPLITGLRRLPERHPGIREDFRDFAYYLKSLMSEDWQSAYMATGDSAFNASYIRNAILPDLDMPSIYTAEFDLRDGFPKDFQYIQFIILTDPVRYLNQPYQHIYDVITHAIEKEELFKDAYQLIYDDTVSDIHVLIYEKVGEYTSEMKEYFYDEMLKYYPDHDDFFKYILD